MQLTGFHVDCFGVFKGFQIRSLPSGLVFFLGDNEAGKSTLMSFFRSILFGFPRNTPKRPCTYAASCGGRLAGRVFLKEASQGDIVLERVSGRGQGQLLAYGSDGSRLSPEKIHALFPGMDRELYKNVFAFSLKELQDFESLGSEKVMGALYGASVGAGSKDIFNIQRIIKDKMDAIFLEKGKVQELNRRLNALEGIRKRLREASHSTERYEEIQHRLEEITGELESAHGAKGRYEEKIREAEKFLKLWDSWLKFGEYEDGLQGLPIHLTEFPEQGLLRLEDIRARLHEKKDFIESKLRHLSHLKEEWQSLSYDEGLLALEGKINDLGRQIDIYVSKKGDILLKEKAIQGIQERLMDCLRGIGKDWDEERILSVERGLFLREEISRHDAMISEKTNKLQKLRDAKEAKVQETERLSSMETSIKHQIEALPLDTEQVSILEARNGDFRAELKDYETRKNVFIRKKAELDVLLHQLMPHAGQEDNGDTRAFGVMVRQAHHRQAFGVSSVERSHDSVTLSLSKGERLMDTDLKARRAVLNEFKELLYSQENLAQELERLEDKAEENRKELAHLGARASEKAGISNILTFIFIPIIGLILSVFLYVRHGLFFEALVLAAASVGFGLIEMLKKKKEREGISLSIKNMQEEAKRVINEQSVLMGKMNSVSKSVEELSSLFGKKGMTKGDIRKLETSLMEREGRIFEAKALLREIREQEKVMDGLENEISKHKKTAESIPELKGVSAEEMHTMLSRLDSFFEKIRERREKEARLTDLSLQRKEIQRGISDIEKNMIDAEEDLEKARSSWEAWLRALFLSPGLSTITALEALQRIDEGVRLISEKKKIQEELNSLKTFCEAWENNVETLLASMGRSVPSSILLQIDSARHSHDSLVVSLERSLEEMKKSKENKIKKEELSRQIKLLEEEVAATRKQVEEAEDDLKALMEKGGAEDEEEFRKGARLYEERQMLIFSLNTLKTELKLISGEEDFETLRQRLKGMRKEALEETGGKTGRMLDELIKKIEELMQERADLRHELKELASSDELSQLRADEERLKEEIRIYAKKWATFKISNLLIEGAKERFEREQQPKIIKDASNIFKNITDNAYEKIISPLGSISFEVEAGDGSRKLPVILSRGTAEQLFLSIRFGYIQNYISDHEAIPILMDDIMVNFDPKRRRQAARAILDLSRECQVLFFSCHPTTLKCFQEMEPNLPVYLMENLKGVQEVTVMA